MSSVLGKNGWWEEAEPSREHSGLLPGLNEGQVWLPLVWFVCFLSTMCLACVLSVSPQTLISCIDPWPFNVAVGVCHLIMTRTNMGRHHFLWDHWPPACRLVWVRKQSLHPSLENKSRSIHIHCSLSPTVAHTRVSFHGQIQGDMQSNTFTRDRFCSMSAFIRSPAKNNE